MALWKYVDDYRVEEYVDDKGKVKNKVVYIAGDYTLYPAISKKNKIVILVLSLLIWVPFLVAFIPMTRASQLYYVMLPFVFNIIPQYLMTTAAVSLLREGDILTREKSDKIVRNLPHCSIIVALLSGVAFLGLVITAIIDASDMLTGDIVFGALSLAIAAASSVIFSKCRLIKARKSDTAKHRTPAE